MPSVASSDSNTLPLLTAIFAAKTSQASLDAAVALSNNLTTLPPSALHDVLQNSILPVLLKNSQDKKSAVNRESGLIALGSLFETLPTTSAVSYLFLTPTLPQVVFDSLADKNGPVKEAAEYAIQAIYTVLISTPTSPLHSISTEVGVSYLSADILTNYLTSSKAKPQGKIGALDLLSKLADKMVAISEESGDNFGRELMGRQLEGLIKGVEGGLFDVKADVARAATNCLTKLTGLVMNEDVRPHMPMLVKTLREGSHHALAKAIHDLSQTTFVALVTSPLLSLLTPILERVLGSPQTGQEVLRQTVVVVENLTKLVHDPVEAREFLPRLLPGVERVEGYSSLPEVRQLAKSCLNVMQNAMKLTSGGEKDMAKRITKEEVEAKLEGLVAGKVLPVDKHIWKETVKKVLGEMIKDIVAMREWERVNKVMTTLLAEIVEGEKETAENLATDIASWCEEEHTKRFGGLTAPKIVHDPAEIEIVNATFSLAYGGMMLLNRTNLRLVKGHRYGLCGQNGAGKSTLMRSIATGKLEGFPSKDELRTCFVEHKMQGEEGDTDIVTYISRALINEGYVEEGSDLNKVEEVLEHVGFEKSRFGQNVGALSGGWKMKLALAEAMLMKADVLLLDEPTNHLDVTNVRWLQDYLKTHTDITSLIVSHDSGFLDDICTDIIHYENKKLVHYKGNLSEFVKVRPEGKAYYTLSATNVQFHFPSPGLLAGVKSMTRSIIKMTDVTYTYPGAAMPSLSNASVSLALSSRTAILGPNGAGKSTLIKLLTGELIAQSGIVEKHPQLRIGYVAQHSLKHVEMHLEKSPSQYLQWRYASGADKEVAMKESRKLTAEDKKQMESLVDIGDGKPKKIDMLIGRQKYKKSYQYEVQWQGLMPKYNSMVSRETLLRLGFQKLIQEFDDKESAREGLGYRELSAPAIREHFEKCGVPGDIAEHNEISGLSGGQKVKVVLAACLWTLPHILVLDEPSNYLDRDSLGALTLALKDFKGGCLIISHNSEFVTSICTEQIHVDAGRIVGRSGGLPNIAGLSMQDGTGSGTSSARPGSSAVSSIQNSPNASAYNSGVEDNGEGESMKFKGRKFAKRTKLTRAQLKEREVRRRLRYIEWLNSPKGTPKPVDTDDEAE